MDYGFMGDEYASTIFSALSDLEQMTIKEEMEACDADLFDVMEDLGYFD